MNDKNIYHNVYPLVYVTPFIFFFLSFSVFPSFYTPAAPGNFLSFFLHSFLLVSLNASASESLAHWFPLVNPTLVVPSFYITVKYLREVTPYFRKASVMADIGWELQSGFLGAENGFLNNDEDRSSPVMTNGPDTRSLPLLFCHLTRNYKCEGKYESSPFFFFSVHNRYNLKKIRP